MQLLIISLDYSKDFLEALAKLKEENIEAIVFPTTSLKHALLNNTVDAPPMFGFLSKIVEHDFKESHTVMILVNDEKLEKIKGIVREITSGLGKKGFMFTVPVSFWEGIAE